MKMVFATTLFLIFLFTPTLVFAQKAEEVVPHISSIENIYPSKYLPGFPIYTKNGMVYLIKTLRDKLGIFFTLNAYKKTDLKLTVSYKKLMEAQSMAEEEKCSYVPSLLENFRSLSDSVSVYVKSSTEKNQDIVSLTSRLYNTLPIQEKTLKRINSFCSQKDDHTAESLSYLKSTVLKYWGLDQLENFHQQQIKRL